ncbi:Uncharacterised protein [Acinetobacter baumannii]|nr:Uncharacterised protein [Acinetobacter baumannii]
MPRNSWIGTPPSLARRPNSRPNTVGAGTEMPFGPPVSDIQLLSTSRMNSPANAAISAPSGSIDQKPSPRYW